MLEACYPELGELPDTDPNNPLNFKKWNPADIEEPDKIKALKAAVEAFLDTKPGTPGVQEYDAWRHELETNVLPAVEDFSYHWGFQYRLNKMHQEDLEAPGNARTIVTMDYMNALTLPLGPLTRSKDWHAGSRLAVNTMGYYVKGAGVESRPLAVFVFSNIVEKPWQLSAAMCTKFLKHLLPVSDQRERIVWWCDCGPHFRSTRFLYWMATQLMSVAKNNFTVCFGPEQHFKSAVDGMFGWLRGALCRATESEMVETIPDLIRVLSQEHENGVENAERAGLPKPMDRVFVELDPEEFPKDSFPVRTFEKWPGKFRSVHKWHFNWGDKRKRVKGRTFGLDGWKCTMSAEGLPVTRFLVKAAPDPDEAAEPTVDARGYPIRVRGGWKVAYTKPEDDLQEQKANIIKRIEQKRTSFFAPLWFFFCPLMKTVFFRALIRLFLPP